MANALYGPGRAGILDGVIRLKTDTIKAVLVDATLYSFSVNHQFLNAITGTANAAVAGSSETTRTLANKVLQPSDSGQASPVSDYGIFDADDVIFTAAANPTGTQTFEAVVLFKETGGADSTKNLVAYIDTAASGLPVTPNGGDITVQWDNGTNRIFAM